ncbi:GAPR1-like protein [Mya arenaria]|uniref:GAPR1-like protein n=1 Tax=Mya arenaria TaxID=6604 RepID=A0ABY7F420_MYAAR|nr:glioma pathogenesis-related protein 1-like [Mya arenaria]WAR16933.1 GAPR1-like protein [Mya arenaria]
MGCTASMIAETNSTKTKNYGYQKVSQPKKDREVVPDFTLASEVKGGEVNSRKEKSEVTKMKEKEKQGVDFLDEAVKIHNEYRSRHGVADLKPSKPLTAQAQKWANEIAERGMLIHSECKLTNGDQIGENIYMCWSSNGNNEVIARDAVRSWYNGVVHYNFDSPEFSYKTGYFTQVVWTESKLLGIACAKSNEGNIYVVANYAPAGNVHGCFHRNVLPRTDSPRNPDGSLMDNIDAFSKRDIKNNTVRGEISANESSPRGKNEIESDDVIKNVDDANENKLIMDRGQNKLNDDDVIEKTDEQIEMT